MDTAAGTLELFFPYRRVAPAPQPRPRVVVVQQSAMAVPVPPSAAPRASVPAAAPARRTAPAPAPVAPLAAPSATPAAAAMPAVEAEAEDAPAMAQRAHRRRQRHPHHVQRRRSCSPQQVCIFVWLGQLWWLLRQLAAGCGPACLDVHDCHTKQRAICCVLPCLGSSTDTIVSLPPYSPLLPGRAGVPLLPLPGTHHRTRCPGQPAAAAAPAAAAQIPAPRDPHRERRGLLHLGGSSHAAAPALSALQPCGRLPICLPGSCCQGGCQGQGPRLARADCAVAAPAARDGSRQAHRRRRGQ